MAGFYPKHTHDFWGKAISGAFSASISRFLIKSCVSERGIFESFCRRYAVFADVRDVMIWHGTRCFWGGFFQSESERESIGIVFMLK